MIRKTKRGYKLVSKKTGRNLSKEDLSYEEVQKRERQVEYFKHLGAYGTRAKG